jgi:hypothetical protein
MDFKIPVSVMTRPDVLPIYSPEVSHVGPGMSVLARGRIKRITHQADTGNIEHECDQSIEKKHERTGVPQVLHLKFGDFAAQRNEQVHHGADGRIIVQTDEGIHLQTLRAQHDLNQNQSHGLKHDSSALEHEADPGELDLAKTGNGDTNDDDEDVDEFRGRRVGEAPEPREEENDDGRGALEHLDEGDGEP